MIARILLYLLVLLALAGTGPTLAFWQSRDSNSNVAISTGACTPQPIIDPTGTAVASNAPSAKATTVAVPAGKTVIAAVNAGFSNVSIISFTDPGNTWNGIQPTANSTNLNGALFYKINAAAIPSGTQFTARTTGDTGTWSMRGAWIACHTGPLDQFSTFNQVSNTTGITVGPTSTLAAADDTAYGYSYVQDGGTVTNDTTYQDLFTNNFNTVGYKNLTVASPGPSFSPTWTTPKTSSNIVAAFRATQPPAAYVPQGVNFNSTAIASKSTALGGVANGKSGLISAWVNNTNATGVQHYLFSLGGATTWFGLRISTGNQMVCEGLDASQVLQFSERTATTTWNGMAAGAWRHFLCSWNLATGRGQIYTTALGTNEASDLAASPTLNNVTLAYASATSASLSGINPWAANVADLQIWFNVDIDLSNTTNRRAFIDASGNAVDPASAQTLVGRTPDVMQCSAPASGSSTLCNGAVSGWVTNKNTTAGGFTLTAGAITAASSNPP